MADRDINELVDRITSWPRCQYVYTEEHSQDELCGELADCMAWDQNKWKAMCSQHVRGFEASEIRSFSSNAEPY